MDNWHLWLSESPGIFVAFHNLKSVNMSDTIIKTGFYGMNEVDRLSLRYFWRSDTFRWTLAKGPSLFCWVRHCLYRAKCDACACRVAFGPPWLHRRRTDRLCHPRWRGRGVKTHSHSSIHCSRGNRCMASNLKCTSGSARSPWTG